MNWRGRLRTVSVVVGHEDCRERLAEYFKVTPNLPIREDPPSFQEVERVASDLEEYLLPEELVGPCQAGQSGRREHGALVVH